MRLALHSSYVTIIRADLTSCLYSHTCHRTTLEFRRRTGLAALRSVTYSDLTTNDAMGSITDSAGTTCATTLDLAMERSDPKRLLHRATVDVGRKTCLSRCVEGTRRYDQYRRSCNA